MIAHNLVLNPLHPVLDCECTRRKTVIKMSIGLARLHGLNARPYRIDFDSARCTLRLERHEIVTFFRVQLKSSFPRQEALPISLGRF